MYAEYLLFKGFTVHEVGTTDHALPLTASVDAVITGLLVAGTIDPIDFIVRVRAMWSTLPIVVVTACVYDDRITKADEAGANIVLLKPCFPETLFREVQQVLNAAKVRLVFSTTSSHGRGSTFKTTRWETDGDLRARHEGALLLGFI